MTDNNENKDEQEDLGSEHLKDALNSFQKGIASLGLFCTEQLFPAAETATKESLKTVEVTLKEARTKVEEAFQKARQEFSSHGNDDGKSDEK